MSLLPSYHFVTTLALRVTHDSLSHVTDYQMDESPSSEARPPGRLSVRERLQRQLGGEYLIARELSVGGSSSVFLAIETALDRPVVLKALPPETAIGMDLERFQREIRFAARLQHPHLVPLLTAGFSLGSLPEGSDGDEEASTRERHFSKPIPWFSMPYVEGDTLRDRLLRGSIPLQEALRIMREIASALSYAHAKGIVHRDIKPENVLMCDGVAMVTDFGVAKALEDAGEAALRSGKRTTTVSMVIGTPAYMAPEQVNTSALVDHKADIYAFGCMAYELLSGEAPLAKPSLRATMAAQLSEIPAEIGEQVAGVPADIASLVMQCLEKDPLRRPHSASAIVRAIDRLHSSSSDRGIAENLSIATHPTSSVRSNSEAATTNHVTANRAGDDRTPLGDRKHIVFAIGVLLLMALVFFLYRYRFLTGAQG